MGVSKENIDKEKMTNDTDGNDEPVINYQGIKAMPYIIGNETFEKLGTVGSLTNLVVYLTTIFHMSSVAANTLLSIFNGTAALATVVGAFLSDTYFGRYKALGFACVASVLAFDHSYDAPDIQGMVVLMLTSAIPILHPPNCAGSDCHGPTTWQLVFLVSGFVFLIIGAGGIRPCNLAFGADQFNPNTESGKRGISSFFNWYYLTYTFAVMVTVTVIVYLQSDVSWTIGLAVPAILMFISTTLFFVGTNIYVIVKPQGSPLTSVTQVFVAATKKKGLQLPENLQSLLFNYIPPNSMNSKLSYTDQFRFLDKAAIITEEDKINADGSANNSWRLCSIQQVEEVKCLLRILPIWASAILVHIPIIQQNSYAVLQALQMDRHLGSGGFQIPAATYIIFIMLTITIWIPIYDRFLVPILGKVTGREGGLTLLQRMGIGMVFAILSMLVSGLIEEQRRHIALTRPTLGLDSNGGAISSMSALWLVPQLALAGLVEAFNYIGQIEFYYKQFPENMRSIATSFFFAGIAFGSYLSGFLISLVHHISLGTKTGDWLADDLNKGRLDYYYYLIGIMVIVNLVYFLFCASWYRYKGTEYNSAIEMSREAKESQNHVV